MDLTQARREEGRLIGEESKGRRRVPGLDQGSYLLDGALVREPQGVPAAIIEPALGDKGDGELHHRRPPVQRPLRHPVRVTSPLGLLLESPHVLRPITTRPAARPRPDDGALHPDLRRGEGSRLDGALLRAARAGAFDPPAVGVRRRAGQGVDAERGSVGARGRAVPESVKGEVSPRMMWCHPNRPTGNKKRPPEKPGAVPFEYCRYLVLQHVRPQHVERRIVFNPGSRREFQKALGQSHLSQKIPATATRCVYLDHLLSVLSTDEDSTTRVRIRQVYGKIVFPLGYAASLRPREGPGERLPNPARKGTLPPALRRSSAAFRTSLDCTRPSPRRRASS